MLRPLVIAALCLVTFTSVACGGGDKKATPTPEPTATPTDSAVVALAPFTQQQLTKEYAGDCGAIDAVKDAGKVCSIAKGEREGQRAYQLNNIGGKAAAWVFVAASGNSTSIANSIPITPDNIDIPGVPWPLRLGVDVVIVGSQTCLNVRLGPSTSQSAVDCIKDGSTIRLSAGPAMGDGLTWYQVEGRAGWVAADYLRYPDAAQ